MFNVVIMCVNNKYYCLFCHLAWGSVFGEELVICVVKKKAFYLVSSHYCHMFYVDVKSWLVMFGFQLSNIIPGFPRHPMYFVDPPYELLAIQDSDHSRVS